ncbi:MAG TPA: hypothetical protein VK844_00160 [Hyphomicrobiales bacterium]|nr:hypothetical protein [Hyphomicrobiales bacterium]
MTAYSKHGAGSRMADMVSSPGGPRDAVRKNHKLAPGKELGTEKGSLP